MDPPSPQLPRGPWNALHEAANVGSYGRVTHIVSSGGTNINVRSPDGYTPLMLAADCGYSRIVKFLISRGAIVVAVGDAGVTALHVSAKNGHIAVVEMLLAAGADVGFSSLSSGGYTPLHLAAQRGICEVMKVLLKAGASVDDRLTDGATAMYLAAERAHLGAVKLLLANKANPMLAVAGVNTPLDVASEKCHVDIVRELVERVGIAGCGGCSRGATALRLAAWAGNVGIMDTLHTAGARDSNGGALCAAVEHGGEKAVKFLLQFSEGFVPSCSCQGAYANSAEGYIGRPVLHCMMPPGLTESSPRVLRRLIDAGADTTFVFAMTDVDDNFLYESTPLETTDTLIHDKSVDGISLTHREMRGIKGIRSLLLQVAAVHAVSWGWVSTGVTAGACAAASTPRALKVPVRKESAARKKRVVRQALFR